VLCENFLLHTNGLFHLGDGLERQTRDAIPSIHLEELMWQTATDGHAHHQDHS
jgi:hypothetical protein